MRSTRNILIGLGILVLGGSVCAGAAYAQPASQAALPRAEADADERAGEKNVAFLPPDLAFAVRVALIRGHLTIGDELVKQRQWAAALPHFQHPVEGPYRDLRDQLANYNVQPFDRELAALAEAVKEKQGGADYARVRTPVASALAVADIGLRERQSAVWAGFVIEAAVEVLKVAAARYGTAVAETRITKPVAYQEARGFILEAERMVTGVAATLDKKDAAALRLVKAGLTEMKKAVPTPMPPRTAAREPLALLGEIARIEVGSARLM